MSKWTVSGKVTCYLLIFGLFTFYLCVTGTGNAKSRYKRQISTDLPRIVTKDGHLLFMTGVNHNITFQSATGGFVNVDGKNLKDVFGKIPDDLKDRLALIDDSLENTTNSIIRISSTLHNELEGFQSQLNLLSDKVQQDLSDKVVQLTQVNQQLKNRIEQLEQRRSGAPESTISNILTRLTTIEGLHRNAESATTASIDTLKQRVSTLEARPSPVPSSVRRRVTSQLRTLSRRVQTLTRALRRNDCRSNPCQNGGSCYDRFNGFHCNCPSGWTGETCGDDVNECAEYSGTDLGCQNGGTCINTPGAYRCECTANWHGLHCNSPHDDCTGASNSEICGHGTCVNQPRKQPGQPKFKCICEAGWTHPTDSLACTNDVDECLSASSCFQHPSVHCINFPGSFLCSSCPPGYTGDGFTCNDIDECEVNNGGCSVNPRVACLNTVGSMTCGPCPTDYVGDGTSCQYVGVCQLNNGGCHSLATCRTNPYAIGGRSCSCAPGYTGTGIGPGGCRRLTPIEDPCQNDPCENGGTCQVSLSGNYSCLCPANFTGPLCETRVNECDSNPCQNGGTCVLNSYSYICECTASYHGTRCEMQREECGGTFYSPSGIISYPSEPGVLYPHGIDCEWVIVVSSSKIVQLNFTTLQTECHYDWIDVLDSDQRYASRIGRFCRLRDVPNNGIINSTGQGVRLVFHSDSSIAREGFNVTWTSQEPNCGYNIQGRHHGILKSPKYPENYPVHRTCHWTITMEPGQRISVMFNTFRLENHHNCNYDYLEIRNGLTQHSPLIGKYCNRILPPSFISSGPYLYFKFHSDGSRTDKGFQLIYTTTEAQRGCGSIINSHTGTLTSPNFPNPYSSNEDCVWIIQPGHTLILTFDNIDLPDESVCTTDYVEIRDGSTPTSPLIGRYCGQINPPEIISNKNSLWINFKSGEATTYAGFSVKWRIACGGVFTNPNGILQSPFYGIGGDNSSDEICIFIIHQPSTKMISLIFHQFGQSVTEKELKNCTSNYIEIRHGDRKSSPLLAKYCGSDFLPPAIASQGVMRVEYRGGPYSLGFWANYTTTDLECGGVITGNIGSITSPHINQNYAHMDCTWYIIVDPDKLIRFTFLNFHLFSRCSYNYVELKNEGDLLGQRFCGYQIPPVFTSTSNKLEVQFSNFYTGYRSSFHGVFHAINQTNVCGSNLQSSSGVVMSPNFPNTYPRTINCIWTIRVPVGNQIQLNFSEFNLEKSSHCMYDSLTIRNGGSSQSPLIGSYCGKKKPFVLLSYSNQIWLMFVSDSSLQRKGFRFTYTSTVTGCGGDMVSPAGSIISPNYPNDFRRRIECVWRIHVSAGSRITLVFVDFNMGYSCYLNSLEIKDPDRKGVQLGRFCGTHTPLPLTSSSNSLFIMYNVKYVYYDNHFRINYHTVCENIHLGGIDGIIESPGFPNSYLERISCSWIISGLYENTVSIEFSHFELEYHKNCSYDYVEVRNGDKLTSPVVGRYCGFILPPVITSSGPKLRIDFKGNRYFGESGFRLEYRQNACIKTFNWRGYDVSGKDLLFPEDKVTADDTYCIWIIKLRPGMRVQLNVSKLELDGADSCTEEFLKITDGDTLKAPVLTTMCHTMQQTALTTSTGNKMTVLYRVKKTTKERKLRASFKAVSGGCGGIYKTVDGSIQSPNYPHNYPRNSNCSWLIVPMKAHFILLKFEDFKMGGSNNCTDNYLQISQNDEVSEVFCHGASLTGRNFTFESDVLLTFKTNNDYVGKGFKVNYTQECGKSYSANTGGIISSDDMQGAASCRWLLIAKQSDERVTLRFSKFYSSINSEEEYVRIYNGYDEMAPEIATYQGRRLPFSISSAGSALYIVASKKKDLVFQATYTTSVSSCGGKIFAGRGSISTPRYPRNYPENIECIWQFEISPGNKIHLSFSEFSLESYDFCNKDYLEARRVNVSGSLIGRFCEGKPENITANSNLWLKFRSDEDNTRSGFIANYIQIFGGPISGKSGQIAIPDWDSPTVPVSWTITVDDGLVIFIVLTQMRFLSFQGECVGYLEFRDGPNAESTLIGQYCEDERVSLFSHSNEIYIKYVPFRTNKQEFSLDWKAVNIVTAMILFNQGKGVTTSQCSSNIEARDTLQNLTSPGFPNNYEPNLSCQWFIYTSKGYQILLNFTTVHIENMCGTDYLQYSSPPSHHVYTLCGPFETYSPIVSTGNELYLYFITDRTISGKGFAASFKRKCGGNVSIVNSWLINSHHFSSDCAWSVHTSNYNTLELNVAFSSHRAHCTDDFLKIHDGMSAASPALLNSSSELCSNYNSTEWRFNTSGSFVYIRLRKHFGSRVIILIQRKGLDGGGHVFLTNVYPSGYLKSVNYPEQYPNNIECEWIINAPGLQRVQIDLKDFDIPWNERCWESYLGFRDGSTRNSPLITRLCGSNLTTSTIYSRSNVMYILFRTGMRLTGRGFKLKYSIAKCGGRIVASHGIIQSDHYPGNYENNLNCKWNILVKPGHFILLEFLDFKLENSFNCTADYIEITDHLPDGDSVLFRGCGKNIPNRIQSSGNEVEVFFKTNSYKGEQGFMLNFTESLQECGGVLENDFGTISSPGYPNLVKLPILCLWKIRVRSDRSVSLQFTDKDSLSCVDGYITVFHGWSSSTDIQEVFCGNIPERVNFFTNEIEVIYHTYNSKPMKFSATYDSDDERLCGGLVTSSSGNITSPDYENHNFTRGIQCAWLLQPPIRANRTTVIELEGVVMGQKRCGTKRLQIFEGVDETGSLMAEICSVPKQKWIMSSSPSVYVLYKAGPRSTGHGFTIRYSSSDCGGILTDDSGVITSPNFPGSYPIDAQCYWKITGPSDFKINITIIEMDLEVSNNCEKDFVKILNGKNPDSPTIVKLCGHKNPISYISQTNNAIVLFNSDNSTVARGFRIIYRVEREVCGGYHHGRKGRIMSPNYPHSYPALKECVWIIKGSPNHVIKVKFIAPFDMERSTDCRNDYVMIEGKMPTSNEIQQKKFCDYESVKNHTYDLVNELTVTFKSNNRISGNGFLIEYETVCHSYFLEQSGYIYSPGYPTAYPNNIHCIYSIVADSNSYVRLKFEDFALEKSLRCRMDYVKIRYGKNFIRSLIFCGNGYSSQILGNAPMKIEMKTDNEITDRGFKFFYEIIECGGTYTEPLGQIENIRHFNYYLKNMNCTYIIQVQQGRVIFLKFTQFKLENHRNCNYDYLAVYDGNTTASRLIGKFCGWTIPASILSTTNTLLLRFVTDSSVQNPGFKAVYQNTFGADIGCGGELGNSTGLLRSIDINNDGFYENNTYCYWKITVDFDKAVQLTFDSFDIQSSTNCEKDSLTILAHLEKEKYCGFQIPPPITSVSNVMEVWFKTDSSVEHSGFRATYTSILNYCGGRLLANTTFETLTSPTRSSLYQPHYGTPKCRWIITAPQNYQIMINITQLDILPNCSGENLKIRDLPAIPGHLYKYCGRQLPPIYYSHTSSVEINFITPALGESTKFSLQYKLADCNRTYTAAHGEIFSPGWPGKYKNNLTCKITILSPVGTKLSLYFRVFKMELSHNCRFDYLQVKYYTNSTHLQTSKFCSSILPPPIYSYNNRIDLSFETDVVIEREGFHIIFTSTTQDSGCGGNLTGINGTFTSPNFPGLYPETAPNNTVPQDKECQWNIRVPAGRQINLDFADFSLGQNSDVIDCIKNHVKIYTGVRSRSTLLTTKCNDNTRQDAIQSISNVMTVVMASDGVARTPKFRITYTS